MVAEKLATPVPAGPKISEDANVELAEKLRHRQSVAKKARNGLWPRCARCREMRWSHIIIVLLPLMLVRDCSTASHYYALLPQPVRLCACLFARCLHCAYALCHGFSVDYNEWSRQNENSYFFCVAGCLQMAEDEAAAAAEAAEAAATPATPAWGNAAAPFGSELTAAIQRRAEQQRSVAAEQASSSRRDTGSPEDDKDGGTSRPFSFISRLQMATPPVSRRGPAATQPVYGSLKTLKRHSRHA